MSWVAKAFCAEIAAAIGVVLVASSPAGAADAAAAPAETPLDVFGHLPTLEDVVLSPDGKRIAYVRTLGDSRNLYIHEFGLAQPLGGVRIDDAKLRHLEWMDNNNLLIEASTTALPPFGFMGSRREWFKLVTYNVSTKAVAPVTFQVSGETTFNVAGGTPSIREVDGVTELFVPGYYVNRQTLPALFKLDVASGRMHLIAKSGELWTNWLVDESGRPGGKFDYNSDRKEWMLRVQRDNRMSVVAKGKAALDIPHMVGFSQSGDSIIVEFIENGDPVWKPIMLKDQTWGAPLAHGEQFRRPIVERKSGRIIGGVPHLDDNRFVFFDNELQAHWDAALRAFPDERVSLLSSSDDFSRMLVRVFGAKDGYAYAIFDWYRHEAIVFGKVYEGLLGVAEVKAISYPAADGFTVPGYLTLPRDRAAKNLPLIVFPHGGPAAADSLNFDWWAQALAAQGYAVLQPNFRGSALNYRFTAAGFGEWGRKMQTDLSDGVRYLAAQGVIDPKRVCIVGASYGGYAALAGVTLDPGVYRCAVSVAGISDLKRLFRWESTNALSNDSYVQRYWDRFMALTGPSDPRLKEISPIEHIGVVSVPVLLIHGRDDTVVPYEQSEIMADALKHAGKPVEFVTLKREDHWLSRSATRLEMLEATVNFLQTNNPP